MKKILIIIAGICLALGISFFLFNIEKFNFAGFAVDNKTSENISSQIITKEIALAAIKESETIIEEMKNNNFSVNSMNDSLIEAKRVFEQAEYAEILRGRVNATEKEKLNAKEALKLIKWQDITYSNVLIYTEEIQKRKEATFLILDKISVEEAGLSLSPPAGISNEIQNIFEQAKIAFSEERYDDAEKLLEDFNLALEKEKSEASVLSGIKRGAKNFFQKYWIYIVIFLIVLGIAGYFAYKKSEKKILKNKIRKMKAEEQVLNGLMKKAQIERFKENKIPSSVYKIRMEKYQKKLQEIKEELPVFEERLKKLKNSKEAKDL